MNREEWMPHANDVIEINTGKDKPEQGIIEKKDGALFSVRVGKFLWKKVPAKQMRPNGSDWTTLTPGDTECECYDIDEEKPHHCGNCQGHDDWEPEQQGAVELSLGDELNPIPGAVLDIAIAGTPMGTEHRYTIGANGARYENVPRGRLRKPGSSTPFSGSAQGITVVTGYGEEERRTEAVVKATTAADLGLPEPNTTSRFVSLPNWQQVHVRITKRLHLEWNQTGAVVGSVAGKWRIKMDDKTWASEDVETEWLEKA